MKKMRKKFQNYIYFHYFALHSFYKHDGNVSEYN